MASIKPHNNGWRAFVCKGGVRKSKVFSVKARAAAWAAQIETEIDAGQSGAIPDKTFGDLLERYRDEVSTTKRGERWERMRIGLTLRDEVARIKLALLDVRAIAGWRDRRLKAVSAASVRREWNLLSHACTVAMKEWKWLRENPMRDVRKPQQAKSRDRLASDDEVERILYCLGYMRDAAPVTASARVGAAVLFAIETAMRAGEIVALEWRDVNLERRFLTVRGGKTDAAKRDVPLSAEAIRIINQIPKVASTLFNVSTAQIDALFRKGRGKALVDGLHFHDLRHAAITRLSKKLDVLALARMVGHRDLRMLMIYYNESAEDMAVRLTD